MNITFNNDVIVKYHIEDGCRYSLPFAKYDDYYFLIIDEVKEKCKIKKLTSKDVDIYFFNEDIYRFKKTDKDILINVFATESYVLEVINLKDQKLNEIYNLNLDEEIQLAIDDYIDGNILYKITVIDRFGKVRKINSLKISSYKKSLRHYLDFKMEKMDLRIVIEYIPDTLNKLMYCDEDGGCSLLSDEEYELLFKDILNK